MLFFGKISSVIAKNKDCINLVIAIDFYQMYMNCKSGLQSESIIATKWF